ncbi:MAG: dihydrofolate reductase family protein [Candidatus Saccharimonadales bacterium]
MRKIVVLSFITLDGVMQAPGGPEEDPSENFTYGGWQAPYGNDARSDELMTKQLSEEYDLLLGRKTYDIFAGYWPNHPEIEFVAGPFNKCTKYVVSGNENLAMPWDHSELITGDAVAKLKELKGTEGPMLQVHGSANLVQTLLKNDLVDELWLKIFPLTLGTGKRLFAEGTIPAAFAMTESAITSNGIIFANYKRAGDVKTGSMI